jgi:hypothetical protein
VPRCNGLFVIVGNDRVSCFRDDLEDRLYVLSLLNIKLSLDIKVIRNSVMKSKVFVNLRLNG